MYPDLDTAVIIMANRQSPAFLDLLLAVDEVVARETR